MFLLQLLHLTCRKKGSQEEPKCLLPSVPLFHASLDGYAWLHCVGKKLVYQNDKKVRKEIQLNDRTPVQITASPQYRIFIIRTQEAGYASNLCVMEEDGTFKNTVTTEPYNSDYKYVENIVTSENGNIYLVNKTNSLHVAYSGTYFYEQRKIHGIVVSAFRGDVSTSPNKTTGWEPGQHWTVHPFKHWKDETKAEFLFSTRKEGVVQVLRGFAPIAFDAAVPNPSLFGVYLTSKDGDLFGDHTPLFVVIYKNFIGVWEVEEEKQKLTLIGFLEMKTNITNGKLWKHTCEFVADKSWWSWTLPRADQIF